MKKIPYYSVLVTVALATAAAGNAWSEQAASSEPVPASGAIPGWYPPRHAPGGYAQPWQNAPRWPAPPHGYGQIPPRYPQQGQYPAAPARPATAATAPSGNAELQLSREQLAVKDSELERVRNLLEQAQSDAATAGAARDTAMAEIDTLRNELGRLRSEQESKTAGLLQDMQAQAEELNRLQHELAARDAQQASLQAALEQAQADAATAGTARDAAMTEIDTLRNELVGLRTAEESKTAGLSQDMQAQAEELNRLQHELAARDARQASLQAALEQAQADAAAAGAARDAATTEADMLRSGLGKLRAAQESKTAGMLQDMEAQAADHSRLQNELAARDARLATLQAELQAATHALHQSQADTDSATSALSEATARVELLDGELAKLRSEVDSWKTTLVDTGQSLADLKLVRDGLLADLNACNLALHQAQPALPDAAPAAGMAAQAPPAAVKPASSMAPASIALAPPGADSDGDRVADSNDLCPGTASGQAVDATGCAEDAAIALEGVNFPYNSHELTAEARGYLDRVAGIISQHPDLRLQVAGHTDATGDPAYNQWLSMQRAEAVMRYLVAQGVNPGHIGAVGYGGQRPIADNDTVDGLRKNRRVELRRLQ